MTLKYTILSLGWTCAILFFTLSPTSGAPTWTANIPHFDKLAHIGVFLILSFLCMNSYRNINFRAILPYAVLSYCLVLGVTIEYIQATIPGRSCEILDVLADFGGGAVGILANKYVKLP